MVPRRLLATTGFLIFTLFQHNVQSLDPSDPECGKSKTCFFNSGTKPGDKNYLGVALKVFIQNDIRYMDLEMVSAQAKLKEVYMAVGFSASGDMGPAFVTEFSSLAANDDIKARLSFNTPGDESVNERISDLSDKEMNSAFSNYSTSYNDGVLYCRVVQQISKHFTNAEVLDYNDNHNFHLLIAKGPADKTGIQQHNARDKTQTTVDLSKATTTKAAGMDKLVKAHAILMVLAWFCFVPTAVFFARFMRDAWPDYKPMGLLVWFHVHRNCNLLGTLLMVASFVCILCKNNWKWSGFGSNEPYWAKVHTTLGLTALILAWLQPFISTMRCTPSNPRRPYFNWVHRLIGVAAMMLASLTIGYGVWNTVDKNKSKTLDIILEILPVTVLVVLAFFFVILNKFVEVTTKNLNSQRRLRYVAVFVAEALLIGITIAFCVIIGTK